MENGNKCVYFLILLSSDRDSHSSSTEGEEDLSSAETSEVCMQTPMSTHDSRDASISRQTDIYMYMFGYGMTK